MYNDRLEWICHTTETIIYKFPPNTVIEHDLDQFVANRTEAYRIICDFLKVKPDRKLIYYITESALMSRQFRMIPQAAIPHRYCASVIYDGSPYCVESRQYGHELTHLLSFFLDKKKYHIELLEEGLATYLDQSGDDHHALYRTRLILSLQYGRLDLSFKIPSAPGMTDYTKAGSIVKFLIETYGRAAFLDLYKTSRVELKNCIFYVENNIMPQTHLYKCINSIYTTKASQIQSKWLDTLGIQI